jgi:ABC-2 type transport system ATP-binding protein
VADKKLNELNQDEEQIVVVEFDYRVETVALQKIPQIKEVKNTAGFVYELTFATTKDMRPEVFDFAHDNGLKILQLHQKHKNLEELFRDLTKAP